MNVYKELDTAFKTKLQTISEFKTVEEYNEQYQNTETDDAKDYPAVYFELIEPLDWQDAVGGWQFAKTTMRMHVVLFSLKRDKLKLHDLSQLVFECLHGATLIGTGDYHLTSKMTRSASSLPKRYRQLKVLTIDFSFEVFDASGMPELGSQLVGFTIVP